MGRMVNFIRNGRWIFDCGGGLWDEGNEAGDIPVVIYPRRGMWRRMLLKAFMGSKSDTLGFDDYIGRHFPWSGQLRLVQLREVSKDYIAWRILHYIRENRNGHTFVPVQTVLNN